jgi:FMN phosphatase YigB (HAD superfamily)
MAVQTRPKASSDRHDIKLLVVQRRIRLDLDAAADRFVGNQLNTDVAGGEAFGIATVWLSGPAYRSPDDRPCDATPTPTLSALGELPALVQHLQAR